MLVCTPALTAPLCRDGKGLFTPCPEALTRAAQRHLENKIATLPGEPATPPPSVARFRRHAPLCRDTKGLFTPCARP